MAIPEGRQQSQINKDLSGKHRFLPAIENQEEFSVRVNPSKETKNPGALAGATEVSKAYEAGQLPRKNTPKGTRVAIVKAARAIAKALVVGISAERAAGLVTIFSARLNEDQKAGIAYAALRSMSSQETAYQVASLAVFGPVQAEVAQ